MCRTSLWAWWMLAWLLVTWSPLWKSFRSMFDTCNICSIFTWTWHCTLFIPFCWRGWSKPCKLEIDFSNESFMVFRQLAGLQWHKRFDRRWSAGYRASPEQQLVSPWQWKWQCSCKKWTWRWSCLEFKSAMGKAVFRGIPLVSSQALWWHERGHQTEPGDVQYIDWCAFAAFAVKILQVLFSRLGKTIGSEAERFRWTNGLLLGSPAHRWSDGKKHQGVGAKRFLESSYGALSWHGTRRGTGGTGGTLFPMLDMWDCDGLNDSTMKHSHLSHCLQMVLSLQDPIWSHSQSLWKAELKAALGCCQSMMSINGTISFWYDRGTRICKRRRSWDCYHTSQPDAPSQHSARLHSFQHNPVPFLHTLPPLPPFSYCDFVVEGILDSFSHFCGLTNKVPSEEWMCQAADEGSDWAGSVFF